MTPADKSPAPSSKIAYLTGEYPAVSHTFILREIEALRSLGADVMTCSIRRTPPQHKPGPAEKAAAASTFYVLQAAKNPATLIAAQLTALRTPRRYARTLALAWRTCAPGAKAALWQMFYVLEAAVLARKLKEASVTHLHNHFGNSSANVALLTSEMSGIPFSYTLHGPAEFYEPHRWRLDEKTRRARFVSCISHFCRSQAMYFSDPDHWHKLRIIHCGVIPALYAGKRETLNPKAGAHFVFVGRVAAVKGLRVLLDAFASAIEQVPDMRLTIVGDGADRATLEARAAPLGGAVTFTGYKAQAEVAEILTQADVFVLPSFAEGLPVSLMEALASEVPVIATRVAGVAELVEDGQHGHLVPPGDSTSLANRMIEMAQDPQARARMGAAGRAKVEQEFDVAQEAARLLELFYGRGGEDPRPLVP